MRDCIKVLALLQQDFSSVMFPVPAEVLLNILLELGLDIEAAAMRLVLDAANQVEPLLKLLFV